MNYIKFCENLINNFGSRLKNGEISTIVLKRKDIDELAKSNPELKSMLDEVVKYTENTTMTIYSKAVSNYEVARFNIRNSTRSVIQGAFSKDNNGTLKSKLSCNSRYIFKRC